MDQSKIESLVETLANTAIGFVIALVSQLVIFPMFDIHVSFGQNLQIGGFFTIVSIARGYLLRRYFNKRLRDAAKLIASKAVEISSESTSAGGCSERA